jgi:hypothetical protein
MEALTGMPELKEMETWTDRLGHSGLRSFTDEEGHFWLEQNAAKLLVDSILLAASTCSNERLDGHF